MAAAAAAKEKDEKISVDEQFLRDFVARGGKAQFVEAEQEIDKENVDEFLRQVVADEKKTASDEEKTARIAEKKTKLQLRAEQHGAADEERLARAQAKDEQARAAKMEVQRKREEDARLSQSQKLRKATGQAAEKFGNSVQPALDKISSAHIVGGIGLLLFVLALLIFTVVQVNANGDTRMKLIWAMLNGNAHLVGRVQPGGQASGNFGGQTGQTPQPSPNGNPLVPLVGGTSDYRQFTGF